MLIFKYSKKHAKEQESAVRGFDSQVSKMEEAYTHLNEEEKEELKT